MGAKRPGGKRPGRKRLRGETTRGGNGLGAKRPGFDARAITCSTVVRMFLILRCLNVSTYEKSIIRSVMLFTVKLSLKNCLIQST